MAGFFKFHGASLFAFIGFVIFVWISSLFQEEVDEMSIIAIINILSSLVVVLSIVIVISYLVQKKIFFQPGIFLLILLLIFLLVLVANVLEYLELTNFLDLLEEYFEISLIPFFLLFLYSLSAHNEIKQRWQKEEELSHALKEREVLIKEVHHRIKNNLQTILSLVSMQLLTTDDENIKDQLKTIVTRISTMGVLHKKLYQEADFTQINLNEYLSSLVDKLKELYINPELEVNYVLEIDSIDISIELAIPCGLIVNEIITNSIKHAFTGLKKGTIYLKIIDMGKKKIQLKIGDNGKGVPVCTDFEQNCGLGMNLIKILTDQIGGEISIARDQGTEFTITIPSEKGV